MKLAIYTLLLVTIYSIGCNDANRFITSTGISSDAIKPYTEYQLRQLIIDSGSGESLVYSTRRLMQEEIERNGNPSKYSLKKWNDLRITYKPRMGENKFHAAMNLADHDVLRGYTRYGHRK